MSSINPDSFEKIELMRSTGGNSGSSEQTHDDHNGSASIDAGSWLRSQLNTRVNNLNEAERLITSIHNIPRTQRPHATSVLQLVDEKFARAFPVSRETLSNPNSQQYRQVKPLVQEVVSKFPGLDILYSSPTSDTEMANSKKVIILQLDTHGDLTIMQRNYHFLLKMSNLTLLHS